MIHAMRRIRGWQPSEWLVCRSDEDRLDKRVERGGQQTSLSRLHVPKARLGNTLAADELLSTMRIARQVIADDATARDSQVLSILDSQGRPLASLMYVINRNLRNPRFTGQSVLRGFPALRDQVYMWRQIRIRCVD